MPPRVNVPLVVGGICGVAVAAQTRINATLADRISSSVVAALISFASGLVVLLVAVGATPIGRRAVHRLASARLHRGLYAGGLIGAAFVAVAAYAAQQVGVAVFVVTAVTGQTLGGLVTDWTGLSPAGRRLPTTARGAAVVIAALGAATTQVGKPVGDIEILSIFIIFVVSSLLPVQTAMNSQISQACGNSQVAAMVNFAIGTSGLLVVATVTVGFGAGPSGVLPPEPWLYAGGFLGAAFIAGMAWAGRGVDMLRLTLMFIGGQLVAGIAADVLVPGSPDVTVFVVVGAIITLLAVGMGTPRPKRVR